MVENIFSMLTLRGLEYILSFLLVPYMLRTLGPANYGAIAFMQSIVAYFNLFIDFGFNLTAPRDLAQAGKSEIPQIFSTYLWAKISLWLGVSVFFIFSILVIQHFTNYNFNFVLFVAVYTSVIGNVLFPIWFFQGIQQMRYITMINLIGRFFTIGCIFILVKVPADFIKAAFFLSCTPLVAGILSLILIHNKFHGILRKPDVETMMAVIKKSKQIFISNLSVNLYTSTDVIILGLLTNNTIVGYYSGADKLIACIKRGISAINDAVYPYITRKFIESREEAFHFLRIQSGIYLMGGIAGGIILLVASSYAIPWLLGSKYISSVQPLQIMAFVPLVVSLSNIFGYEIMLPLGMENVYSRILICASVLNLVIISPLVLLFQASGASLAMLVTELFVTIVMGYILHSKSLFI